MRFITAAALFTGAAVAQGVGLAGDDNGSTVYKTKYYTVTSCEPTVTDCPSEVSSSVVAMTTSTVYSSEVNTVTKCPGGYGYGYDDEECKDPVTAEETTHVSVSETLEPVHPEEPTMVHTTKPHYPYPTESECESVSVKAITTHITTVIPTVIYETVDLPCEETTAHVPTGGVPVPSGSPVPSTPIFTGGAASNGISIAAIMAGALALLA